MHSRHSSSIALRFSTMEKERLGPLTRNVAANLRALRKQRGMSLAEVSEQLEQLGAPLSLNAVSKIELGNRGVDLDEVTALARALRVPPLLLIFPVGRADMTEVLPGVTVGTWPGAKWFTGEEPFPTLNEADLRFYAAGSDFEDWQDAATKYFREQDQMFATWNAASTQPAAARKAAARPENTDDEARQWSAQADFLDRTVEQVESVLRRHRASMRKAGLDPGELTDNLAHVDQAERDDHGQR